MFPHFFITPNLLPSPSLSLPLPLSPSLSLSLSPSLSPSPPLSPPPLQCSHRKGRDQFFSMISNSPPDFVALLGAGCSAATLPVAEMAHYWNFPIVRTGHVTLM